MIFTCDIQSDENGELVLQLNDEILREVGWKIGDTINWIDNHDGTWALRIKQDVTKQEQEKELVFVECVSTFNISYMVEVPKGKSEYALDAVVCGEATEFSQEFIGEQIFAHRVVSEQEAFKLCDERNHYAKDWSNERKIKAFFTKDNT